MGTVYCKTATKPLPAGARIIVREGRRLAQWEDAKGKARKAPVTVGQVSNPSLASGLREWAMADSNGRPPRCKRGVLTN